MNKQKEKQTCEDLVDSHLEQALESLEPEDFTDHSLLECARYLKSQGEKILTTDIDEIREHCADHYRYENEQSALSITKHTTYKILLSWGGPSSFFELNWDGEDWIGGSYHYQDWFDGARRSIDAATAERVAEHYCVYPSEEC